MLFSETHLEIDVQELCSKYNLDYNEYNKIKQIVIQGAHDPEPDPDYATLFFMESGYYNFEKCSHLVIEEIKIININLNMVSEFYFKVIILTK